MLWNSKIICGKTGKHFSQKKCIPHEKCCPIGVARFYSVVRSGLRSFRLWWSSSISHQPSHHEKNTRLLNIGWGGAGNDESSQTGGLLWKVQTWEILEHILEWFCLVPFFLKKNCLKLWDNNQAFAQAGLDIWFKFSSNLAIWAKFVAELVWTLGGLVVGSLSYSPSAGGFWPILTHVFFKKKSWVFCSIFFGSARLESKSIFRCLGLSVVIRSYLWLSFRKSIIPWKVPGTKKNYPKLAKTAILGHFLGNICRKWQKFSAQSVWRKIWLFGKMRLTPPPQYALKYVGICAEYAEKDAKNMQ